MGYCLDEIIARRSVQNPDIPKLVDQSVSRRRLQYVQPPPKNAVPPDTPGRHTETAIAPATPKRAAV